MVECLYALQSAEEADGESEPVSNHAHLLRLSLSLISLGIQQTQSRGSADRRGPCSRAYTASCAECESAPAGPSLLVRVRSLAVCPSWRRGLLKTASRRTRTTTTTTAIGSSSSLRPPGTTTPPSSDPSTLPGQPFIPRRRRSAWETIAEQHRSSSSSTPQSGTTTTVEEDATRVAGTNTLLLKDRPRHRGSETGPLLVLARLRRRKNSRQRRRTDRTGVIFPPRGDRDAIPVTPSSPLPRPPTSQQQQTTPPPLVTTQTRNRSRW